MTHPWLKSYPEGVSWEKEFESKAIFSLLDESAETFSNKYAIDFMGKKYSYAQLNDLVNKATKGLQDQGVTKGTKVGLFLPNTPVYIIFYYAILKAGGTVVNFSPLYAENEVVFQIKDSGTEVMVTLDLELLYPQIRKMLDLTDLKKIVVCPLTEQLPFPKNILFPLLKGRQIANIQWDEKHVTFLELLDNAGDPKPVEIDLEKDTAVIQYTGGTTGRPKGAMLTHKNVYVNTLQAHEYTKVLFSDENKVLAVLPFFHVFAMTAVLNLGMKVGAEIIIQFPRFDPEGVMKLIQKHKITLFPGVPTIFNLLLNHPKISKYDLSSLKGCLSGGASLPMEVKEPFEKLTGCKMFEGYGLSETSPLATLNPLQGTTKDRSIGIPAPGTIVKILDPEDSSKEMPLGEKGEICIGGPQVMKGYHGHKKETAETIIDDFLHTGDIGYMDEDGFTFLIDRIKDLIIVNGYNVYPRNVEDAIYLHSAVEEVIVLGVPNSVHGKTVKAFVKLKDGESLTSENLIGFLKDKLSTVELPREIRFRDELPKTMVGKLSKKDLLEEEVEKLKHG